MIEIIIQGFILGLSTGTYCLGFCAPLFIPYLLSEHREVKRNFAQIAEFLFGRLIAYIIFGVLIGFTGKFLETPLAKNVVAIGVIASSVLLITYGILKNAPQFNICKKIEKSKILSRFPLLLGMTIGINVCPPFIQGVSYLLSVGRVDMSIIFFISFFFGTSIFMLPLIFSGFLTKLERLLEIARVASVIAGVWFFIYGVSLLF